MFAVKVAGGVLGLGLVGIAGLAMHKPMWFGIDIEPEAHSLSQDSDYSTKKTSDYKDKFGSKYSRYLVGVNNEKDQNDKNEAWWEWSFRRFSKEGVGSKFQNIDKGYGTDEKALKKVCEDVYKAESTNIKASNAGDSDYTEADVWKYCSLLEYKPVTVDKATDKEEGSGANDSTKIGKSNESELVSTLDPKNHKFWKIRDKEFRSNPEPFKIIDSDNKYFKKQKEEHPNKSIKDICKEAYNKDNANSTSADDKPTKDEVKKFCTFPKNSSGSSG